MAGPWEKYGSTAPADPQGDGPWSRYNGALAAPAGPDKADFSSIQPDVAKELAGYGDNVKGAWDAVTHGRLPIGANVPVLGPAVKQLASMPAAAVAALTGDQSFGDNLVRLSAARDAEDAQFAQDHPTANGLSQLAGAAALPAPPLLEAAKGAGALARAGVGAANAAMRVGANTAISAADAAARGQDPLEAAKRAALVGGGLEAAGGLAGVLGRTAGRAGETLDAAGSMAKDLAEEKAFRAAVGNQSKAYNQATATGSINARGRDLLDSGVVGFGDSAQAIAGKAAPAKAQAWDDMQAIFAQVDQVVPNAVSGQGIADAIREEAQKIQGKGNEAVVGKLHDAAEYYEKLGDVPLSKAQIEKNSWKFKFGDNSQVNNTVKGAIGDEMEAAVGRAMAPAAAPAAPPSHFGQSVNTGQGRVINQPDGEGQMVLGEAEAVPDTEPATLAQRYVDAKGQYGTMSGAVKDAQVNANRYAKNNAMSLGDKAAAAAGMALNPHGTAAKVATGFVAGAANKLIRKRGDSAAAVSLDKIGDVLKATPEFFGKYAAPLLQSMARGDQQLAVTHYLLMQQDPDYQKLVSGEGE